MDKKQHWENIYSTKELKEVSWFQPIPKTSIDLITSLNIEKSAPIIDIGGGDSFLVDSLLDLGYSDITVLDISSKAIEKAKERLGPKANQIKWIVSNIVDFIPDRKYAVWHDRAVFHFLTNKLNIEKYKLNLNLGTTEKSQLIIATFSDNGPDKCSGILIQKYSQEELVNEFENWKKVKSFKLIHETPFNTEQEFTFVHLEK